MEPERGRIGFRRITASDEPLLRGWLAGPHVRVWWGDPEEEIALIRSGEETGESEGYIALLDARPVAYLQVWTPSAHDEEEWQTAAPPSSRGIDMFVGPADCLGRGIGPRVLRAFAQRLFAGGVPRLVIDPDAANARAVRAYEKAGFRRFALAGRMQDTILMELAADGRRI